LKLPFIFGGLSFQISLLSKRVFLPKELDLHPGFRIRYEFLPQILSANLILVTQKSFHFPPITYKQTSIQQSQEQFFSSIMII